MLRSLPIIIVHPCRNAHIVWKFFGLIVIANYSRSAPTTLMISARPHFFRAVDIAVQIHTNSPPAKLLLFLVLAHDSECMGWFDLHTFFVGSGYEQIKFFHLGFCHDPESSRKVRMLADYRAVFEVLARIVTNGAVGSNEKDPGAAVINTGAENNLFEAGFGGGVQSHALEDGYATSALALEDVRIDVDKSSSWRSNASFAHQHNRAPGTTTSSERARAKMLATALAQPFVQTVPVLGDFLKTLKTLTFLEQALHHPFLVEYEAKNRIDLLYKLIQLDGDVYSLSGNLMDAAAIGAELERVEFGGRIFSFMFAV